MMALLVIAAFIVYLLISIWVVMTVLSWAAKNKRSGWWGFLAAFVMYNLVFWDWIPTVVAHKYYCATEAGFWVYKTPEQWMKEHPKMKEGVAYQEKITKSTIEKHRNGNKMTSLLNQRTTIVSERINESMVGLLDVTKRQNVLKDATKNKVLMEKITFEAGHPSGAPKKISHLKTWINLQECKGVNGNTVYKNWHVDRKKYVNLGEEND